MKKTSLLVLVAGLMTWAIIAQGRASMQPPVIKGTVEVVSFSTNFYDFVSGNDYRLGVGTAGVDVPGMKMELTRDGNPVSAAQTSFSQGHSSSWFDVDSINVKGYDFEGQDLSGQTLTLRVTVPRAEANAAGKIFVLISRKYGANTWYLEDGAELSDKYW